MERYMNDLVRTPKYNDLIYDVGMHKGEDTEFYLSKGFRVVAFEADPKLVSSCKVRFKRFIEQGQLKIVEGAIVDIDAIETGQKIIYFYRYDQDSARGTVRADFAEGNSRFGMKGSMIEVDVVNFVDAMGENGVPHFLKIDIEGMEMVCLKALRNFQERPDYVSIQPEMSNYAGVKREIDILVDLGYDSFQAI